MNEPNDPTTGNAEPLEFYARCLDGCVRTLAIRHAGVDHGPAWCTCGFVAAASTATPAPDVTDEDVEAMSKVYDRSFAEALGSLPEGFDGDDIDLFQLRRTLEAFAKRRSSSATRDASSEETKNG